MGAMRRSNISKGVQRSAVDTRYGVHRIMIEPDAEGGFDVTALDLPGVVTWGRNMIHAKEMVREAIELCIECLVEERVENRSPRSSRTRVAVPA